MLKSVLIMVVWEVWLLCLQQENRIPSELLCTFRFNEFPRTFRLSESYTFSHST
jgi:hypothetical protein